MPSQVAFEQRKPFRIAAFPDFIASDAILAITSGRASNIISRTPIGKLTLSKSRSSSRRVLKVTLPTKTITFSKVKYRNEAEGRAQFLVSVMGF